MRQANVNSVLVLQKSHTFLAHSAGFKLGSGVQRLDFGQNRFTICLGRLMKFNACKTDYSFFNLCNERCQQQ